MNIHQTLPIYENKKDILYLLEKYSTLIIIGTTGCGKTTQIPKYLWESGWADGGRQIVCTQPRRISTVSVATRVADEMNQSVGKTVGYSVRFDEQIDDNLTRIKYTTDGMLLREMMLDPLLLRYSVIMVDEAHERSLNTDMLFGLLKKIQKARFLKKSENSRIDELKLIISSATLQVEQLQKYFQNSYILTIGKGQRIYPVDIMYLEEPCINYLDKCYHTVIDIQNSQPPGDILVFLTGKEEIDTLIERLDNFFSTQKSKISVVLLALYSQMSMEKQLKVFQQTNPSMTRKVIVSTNVAETSLTIDGIVYVVDCGFIKIKSYSPLEAMESLVVVPVSQSSANQRSGRAGRNRPGKCYRLYTEDSFSKLDHNLIPEISRSNLTPLILQLKNMGIDNILNFDFLTLPPTNNLASALETLYKLGAIDDNGKLTETGGILSEFPLDPQLSKVLLTSQRFHCTFECLIIVSMLSLQSNLYDIQSHSHRKDVLIRQGDHLTLLNIFQQFQQSNYSKSWCKSRQINYKSMTMALKIKNQLQAYLKKFSIPIQSIQDTDEKDLTIPIRKCIVAGFFNNIVRLQSDGTYKSIGNPLLDNLYIHPISVLSLQNSSPFLLYNEILYTTKRFIKDLIVIEPEWLIK
ncbi:DEAD/DEAH box helicase [Tieghemostelium lacteum]|uniref:RNA helicase n=1 Tax=Tieghemostelium lacteum TaxID=361077 RepID=A0A151Z3R5_TIELA|nr:DEAD/DEAH box helicase [Tieghemostelium lacteum]|eukprot:KYQ88588.1 DEAD/DEAH box helicase [Tieghemostelium lacteum]